MKRYWIIKMRWLNSINTRLHFADIVGIEYLFSPYKVWKHCIIKESSLSYGRNDQTKEATT